MHLMVLPEGSVTLTVHGVDVRVDKSGRVTVDHRDAAGKLIGWHTINDLDHRYHPMILRAAHV